MSGAAVVSRRALLVAAAALLVAAPHLVHFSDYYLNLFMEAATYAVAVLGLTVVLGYAGQISLTQAAFFAIGAYALALGTTQWHLSFGAALLAGLVLATLAGTILGLTTLRLASHYLAMVTISFQEILTLVLTNWVQVTKGPDGVTGIPRPHVPWLHFSDGRAYLSLCIIVLLLTGFAVWRLAETRLGRGMRAVRENELAAEVVGVPTFRVKVIAFAISAFLGGLGGALFAAGFSYISPDAFTFDASVVFLTMALLGGAQSAVGGTVGTLLLVLLPEWLRFLKQIYLAVYGMAVILLMVFVPEGLVGIWEHVRRRLFRRRTAIPTHVAPLTFAHAANIGPLMRIESLHKHFGGLRALDGIDMVVTSGHVHALIGPNGSGKTTLLNVLNGIYRPTSGRILFGDREVQGHAPHDLAALGLGRTFQNIRLFRSLSVLENVMIGAQRPGNAIGRGDEALRARAFAALDFVGLLERSNDTVADLPYGQQRWVEIARALALDPKLLLLDEPAAGLNTSEKLVLVELLKRLRARGSTILLIEHDVALVEEVADQITVLNFGKKIAEGSPEAVLRHPEVVAAYLGEGITDVSA